jgi:hypothetical protein
MSARENRVFARYLKGEHRSILPLTVRNKSTGVHEVVGYNIAWVERLSVDHTSGINCSFKMTDRREIENLEAHLKANRSFKEMASN